MSKKPQKFKKSLFLDPREFCRGKMGWNLKIKEKRVKKSKKRSKSTVIIIKSDSTSIKNSFKLFYFLTFFNFFHVFLPIFACLPGRPIKKPQKRSKTRLPGIRCCLLLVFHQVFGVKIKCESKVTFTVVSQSPKSRKSQKIIFFAYFPGINMSLFPGRLFEKP